ncbi:MAG: DEAD/DEAH box helicase [Bacteroidales bacterium]
MRELRFALGYMPHRLWGNILQAQFLEKDSNAEFYSSREYVQNDPGTAAFQRLSPMQREVVQEVDAYNDRKLHRLFSKKPTVKQFQDSVEAKTIQEHIRPYIEKHMHRALEIARDNRIPLFVKDKSNRNIFPEDFIRLERKPGIPLFSFAYGEQLSYALQLIHGEHPLVLKDRPVELVCNNPLVILLGDVLYFINDIDGKKLKPFLTKEEVRIPPDMEKKYLGSFVRNTLRDFQTRVEGIVVSESEARTQALLTLERGLSDLPVWILEFQYNQHKITADNPIPRFVEYEGGEGSPRFVRCPRKPAWEEGKKAFLHACGLRTRDDRIFQMKSTGGKAGNEALYEAVSFMNEYGTALEEEGFQIRQRFQEVFHLGPISLDLQSSEKEDWFDLYGTVHIGEVRIPFLSLKHHILSGERTYTLPDGTIAVLPLEWFSRYRSVFEFGKISDGEIRIHKQHFSQVAGVGDIQSETLEKLDRLNRVETLPALEPPRGLNATLRTYQREGYQWLCVLQEMGFGGCLADDMGLGKTLQAIAVLLRARENGSGEDDRPSEKPTSLVVVPASLLHNWESECRRFAPSLKVCLHVGGQRNREISNFSYYDVILSTYHIVRQDIEQISAFPFHYVILDESQMIKNPASKLYQAISDLQAGHRLVLTGTPIENSLTDLWSQINFVNPGLLGSLNFFRQKFVMAIEKKKDEEREAKLKELINPFILRRTKQEVATELPPVYEQVRYCTMTEDQKRLYEEEKSQARNSILENLEEVGMEHASMMVLQALTRLRQIANHPALVENGEDLDSGKYGEVLRNVESVLAEGHKVLIFSSFVKHLDLFREHFDREGLRYAYLTGSRNQKQRTDAVNAFQTDPACSLFLISLKAGGTGLNLTAAEYVFILDPWWNPAAEMQALNRAHRIGQDQSVFVYRFISSNTIEEKIQVLQEKKRALAQSFVTASNPLRDLDEKEILELFN